MDVVDEIVKDFEERAKKDPTLKSLNKVANKKNASYSIAHRYAIQCNDILNASIAKYAHKDDIELKRSVLSRLFGEGLSAEHNLIATITEKIQKQINKEAKIGLKALKPKLNVDRITGLTKHFVGNPYDTDVIDDVLLKRIHDFTENFSLSIVDDSIKDNAELQSNAGLHAVIVRIASADACPWCAELAGVYDYEEVKETGNPVFMRHTNCNCEVTYKCEKDSSYLNVHDKKTRYDTEEMNKRIAYSRASNERFYSQDAKQRRLELHESLLHRRKKK